MPNGCRSHRTDKQVNFANSYGTHILSQPDLADTRSLGDEEALFARRDLIALLVDNGHAPLMPEVEDKVEVKIVS